MLKGTKQCNRNGINKVTNIKPCREIKIILDFACLILCWHLPGICFPETGGEVGIRTSPALAFFKGKYNPGSFNCQKSCCCSCSRTETHTQRRGHVDALGSVSGSKYSYFCTAGSHGNALSCTWAASATWLAVRPSVCPSSVPAPIPPGAISQPRQQLFAYSRNSSAPKKEHIPK